jgi:hypothetical protein
MIVKHILGHGLAFAVVANGYLFLVMLLTSPRVWGLSDYPPAIKAKVPAQTKREKRLAALVALPWFAFLLGFPVFSTLSLKVKLGGDIPLGTAFLSLIVLYALATIGDLVILDWLVISKLTPRFVIIPGTETPDYKDFSDHFKGHVKGAIATALIALALAAVISSV